MRKITEFIILSVLSYDITGVPKKDNAIAINGGYCADFATLLHDTFGADVWNDEELGGGAYSHTFVRYKGKYYDSECPLGVRNWKNLPIFLRNRTRGLKA